MSTVQEIEKAIQSLPKEEIEAIHQWIEDYLEDEKELSAEARAAIACSEQEMAAGKGRLHRAGG